MQANHFGQMLIIIGVFIALVMFFMADWSGQVGFMQNIRYAQLICIGETGYYCPDDAINIKLGEGLIMPLITISLGLMIVRNIISETFLGKIMPFIQKSDKANQ